VGLILSAYGRDMGGTRVETRAVTLAGQRYVLATVAAADQLQALVVDAARAGGGFVDVDTLGGARFAILVTAHTPVVFEFFEYRPEDLNASDDGTGSFLDYDYDL